MSSQIRLKLVRCFTNGIHSYNMNALVYVTNLLYIIFYIESQRFIRKYDNRLYNDNRQRLLFLRSLISAGVNL